MQYLLILLLNVKSCYSSSFLSKSYSLSEDPAKVCKNH